ncbi:MAG: ubiquinol-cytochrome C chaperone family protein [Rhodospirillaceae bacterium]
MADIAEKSGRIMGLFDRFREARRANDVSNRLYVQAVEQARSPAFFTQFGVPDTVDGRFDLIILHIMLLIRRLRGNGKLAGEMSQSVLNHMFSDMDRNLREMGVGDLSVGKQVKKMAKAFYGRSESWEEGIDSGRVQLMSAFEETVYRSVEQSSEQVSRLADYALTLDQALNAQDVDRLLMGEISFTVAELQAPAA